MEQQSQPKLITIAYGNGIGPEIMEATLQILNAAGARITTETVEIGEAVYERGFSAGIEPSTWEALARSKVFLKAPITTPQGGGFKSLNVTIRKTLGLFANVRPCVSYDPVIATSKPGVDLVIVRENEEDLYAGIEHRQTDEVYQALKLITLPGTEKIIRYAFEYAKANGRIKVTCMTKDNIMKLTDGLFHKTFDRIATEYPDIEADHYIIDIGMARVADTPEWFDVIVTENLYGDIISDVAAQVTGSVGLAGSANLGDNFAMFEAIHGSAPDIAGKDMANPSGLLQAAVMMLVHIGQPDVAEKVQNAWLSTIEEGIHTGDIYEEGISKKKVGTREFAEAIIERLGQKPRQLRPAEFAKDGRGVKMPVYTPPAPQKVELVGADVFINAPDRNADRLAQEILRSSQDSPLKLKLITNRGVKVWPEGNPSTFCIDQFRCRFRSEAPIKQEDIFRLLEVLGNAGLPINKYESLQLFDGEPGFSMGQGE
jgi:isocitrate dehydrogenase